MSPRRASVQVKLAAVWVACAAHLTAVPAATQEQGLTPTTALPTSSPLVALLPEAKNMPAPPWLTEGMRVSYYGAAATLPAERFYWYKDYRDLWMRADEVGPAGGGPMQYSCIAVDEGHIIGNVEVYPQDASTGVMMRTPVGVATDVPGIGAVWVNPQALEDADRFQSADLKVIKLFYLLDGVTYRAIVFHLSTPTYVTATAYDLDSGVMLYDRNAAISADGRYTHLRMQKYLGRRKLPVPWLDQEAPEWAHTDFRFRYDGAFCVLFPGSPVLPMPSSMLLERSGGGRRWTRFRVARTLQGMPMDSTEIACGVAQLGGGVWMPRQVLQGMTAGQVLDEDNITGLRTVVEAVRALPGGRRGVLITQTCKGCQYQYGYDCQDGRLVYLKTSQAMGIATQVTEVNLAAGA